MPTKAEYLAQGKSEQQIQDATVAKNTAAMSANLGQNIQATNYNIGSSAMGWTTRTGQIDSQTPINAQSKSGVQINTEAMQQYNPNYNPNVASGVSWVMGTPTKPAVQEKSTLSLGNQEPRIAGATSIDINSDRAFDAQWKEIVQTKDANGNLKWSYPTESQKWAPPTQVEKTTTTTPQGETVVKKETPQVVTPDFNVWKGREQDILNNLNTDLGNNVKIQQALQNGDYTTFKQNYQYDTADETKKKMLDAFFQANQPKNSDSFLQILATGQKLQNAQYRASPEAADAQHRYDVLSPYIGAGATPLYDAMVSGKLLPGSDAYKDLLKVSGGIETPAMTEAKIKFERKQQIDKVNNNLANLSGNKVETTTGLQKISDNLVQTKGMDYATEFQKDVVNNPAITEKVTELNSVTEQIKNLEYTKSKTLKEVMAKHNGISIGSAILEANRQNEGINDELNQLYNKQGALKANVDYATNLAEKMFGYKIQQNQEKVKAEQDIASEDRQFGRQKELAQYQQDLALQGNQAEFEQQMKQKAQIASDPVMATQEVLDTYAKLGILPERSNAEIIQSVQNDIASGMTLGQSLTNLNKAFQSKPQYKAAIAPKPTTEGQVWTKLDDTTLFNQATGETKSVKPGTPISTDEINSFTTTRNGSTSVQCGELVNDYWKKVTGSSAGIGNSINDKYGAISNIGRSETPIEGGIFVSNPLNNNIGHTGIVSKVNIDGSIEVREANAQGKTEGQPPITKTYSAQQVANMRFSQAPTIKLEASPIQWEAKSWVDTWNKWAMDLETILTKIGSTKEALPLKNEVIRQVSSQGGVAWRNENDPAVSKVQDMITKLDTASKSSYINTIAGTVQTSLTNFLTQWKSDLLADLRSVVEWGTLQQLIDAKASGATFGALSNEELKMLQATSSALAGNAIRNEDKEIIGFRMSESKLKSEIDKIKLLLEEKKNRMTGRGIVPQSPTVEQTGSWVIQYNWFNLPR